MSAGNLLSSVFGRSPIGPIKLHISKVHECSLLLEPFFQAVFIQDWGSASILQEKIVLLENEADKMKKTLRLSLPHSLFLPVPRTDLLKIVTVQDKIANLSKDIVGIVVGRMMTIPESIKNCFIEYVLRSVDASAQALLAVNQLDELVETGFKGREVKFVEQLIEELDAIESETDTLQVEVRHRLFDIEKELPAIDVMFLYKIIDWIGDLADCASRVGSYLQILLAR